MIWSPPGRSPTLTAEELAAAMREGLESRRFFRRPPRHPDHPGPTPPVGPLWDFLAGERPAPAPLSAVPIPAGGGVRGRVVRLLRWVARKVLRPWLDHQSELNAVRAEQADRLARFDHAVFWYLESLRASVAGLAQHVHALQQEVAGEVLPGYQAASGRLNECFHDLYRLRQLLGPAAESGAAAVEPLHVIEGLFLLTRLPAPPARVLTTSAAHALDLASLGFQVVTAGPVAERHPELQSAGGGGGDLPFGDAAFDMVVALTGDGVGTGAAAPWTAAGSAARAELARVLVPGGSVVGSVRAGDDAPTPAEVAALVAPFRLVEVVYAARAGDGWGLHSEPVAGGETVLWVAVRQ